MSKSTKPPQTNSADTALLSVWVPRPLLQKLDDVARREDTDRSKLVRRILRQTVSRPA